MSLFNSKAFGVGLGGMTGGLGGAGLALAAESNPMMRRSQQLYGAIDGMKSKPVDLADNTVEVDDGTGLVDLNDPYGSAMARRIAKMGMIYG